MPLTSLLHFHCRSNVGNFYFVIEFQLFMESKFVSYILMDRFIGFIICSVLLVMYSLFSFNCYVVAMPYYYLYYVVIRIVDVLYIPIQLFIYIYIYILYVTKLDYYQLISHNPIPPSLPPFPIFMVDH